MKTLLKRKQVFNYEKVFGGTDIFLPTLLLDTDISDVEPQGSVICVPMAFDKIASLETGFKYDHQYLWTEIVKAGKASSGGTSPQDGFAIGCKGIRRVSTGEIDTFPAYFQTDIGTKDFFTNVKSAIQMEYNKGNKRANAVGTFWYKEWENVTILPLGKTPVSDHEWLITGWDEEHGDMFRIDSHEGYYKWVPREVFNAAMDATYGSVALTIAQTTQEVIDYLKATEISLIQKILDFLWNELKHLQAIMQ